MQAQTCRPETPTSGHGGSPSGIKQESADSEAVVGPAMTTRTSTTFAADQTTIFVGPTGGELPGQTGGLTQVGVTARMFEMAIYNY